jgi:hypothetical protein
VPPVIGAGSAEILLDLRVGSTMARSLVTL